MGDWFWWTLLQRSRYARASCVLLEHWGGWATHAARLCHLPQVCTLLVSPLVRSIAGMRVFEDTQFGTLARYLLVHTTSGRYWRLVLELQERLDDTDLASSVAGSEAASSTVGGQSHSASMSGHVVGAVSLGVLHLSTRSALAKRVASSSEAPGSRSGRDAGYDSPRRQRNPVGCVRRVLLLCGTPSVSVALPE